MSPSLELAVAMDLGGTWARASVIDRQGQVIWSSLGSQSPQRRQGRIISRRGKVAERGVKPWV